MGGCFLACFGPKDGDRKRRNRRKNKILPRDQRHGSPKPIQPTLSLEEEEIVPVEAVKPVSEVQALPEEPSCSSTSSRKKVTFDTNVKTYEPLPVFESIEALPTPTNGDGENQDENCGESSLLKDDSIVSSVGSYPPNHRYQNCRDSDDDDELVESEFEDSDLDEDEDDDEICNEVWSEMIPAESMESTTEASSAFAEEVESHPMKNRFIDMDEEEEEEKRFESRRVARNRSVYVHPLLNPVQNLTQWKALKSKPSKPQKENASEFNQSSMNFRSKICHSKHQSEEISVDASLSNWLGSSETSATQKSGFEAVSSQGSMSYGSNSAMSIEDRPILGALTVEELKQHSATNSPRRSPCRSPDDMPILGTVGRYWSHQDPAKTSSGSSPSYKGMPNTRRGLYVK